MSTLKAYITGFALSILLTLAAFLPVYQHVKSGHLAWAHSTLTILILILAVVQLCVQLFLFLHLGREKKPRWNLMVFATTLSLILIVVIGSLWIMAHLNYNMTPEQINNYLQNSDAF